MYASFAEHMVKKKKGRGRGGPHNRLQKGCRRAAVDVQRRTMKRKRENPTGLPNPSLAAFSKGEKKTSSTQKVEEFVRLGHSSDLSSRGGKKGFARRTTRLFFDPRSAVHSVAGRERRKEERPT